MRFLFVAVCLCAFLCWAEAAKVRSVSTRSNFWTHREANWAARTAVTRGLGEMDRNVYQGFNIPRESLREQSVTNFVLHWIAVTRRGTTILFDADPILFPNAMPPLQAAAKFLAKQFSLKPQTPPYNGTLETYIDGVLALACDLDYEQPAAEGGQGTEFGAEQDWCATEVMAIFGEGRTAAEITEHLKVHHYDDLAQKEFKQYNCASHFTGPTRMYFACVLSKLDIDLYYNCERCCSPLACAL
ncbi:hypothetical protein QOT17_023438 [Balamuthia mandrillaris]